MVETRSGNQYSNSNVNNNNNNSTSDAVPGAQPGTLSPEVLQFLSSNNLTPEVLQFLRSQQVMSPAHAGTTAEAAASRDQETARQRREDQAVQQVRDLAPQSLSWDSTEMKDMWCEAWITSLRELKQAIEPADMTRLVRGTITNCMIRAVKNPSLSHNLSIKLSEFRSGAMSVDDVIDLVRREHSCPDGSVSQIYNFCKDLVDINQLTSESSSKSELICDKFLMNYPLNPVQVTILVSMYLKYSNTAEFSNFLSSFAPFTSDKPNLTRASLNEWIVTRCNGIPPDLQKKRAHSMKQANEQLVNLLANRRSGENNAKRGRGDNNKVEYKEVDKKKKPKCHSCGNFGHMAFECKKRKASESDKGGSIAIKPKDSSHMVGAPSYSPCPEVLLDSCSSLHLLNDKSFFCGPLKKLDKSYNTAGGPAYAEWSGDARIVLQKADGDKVVWPIHCYYNPRAPNIVSAKKLQVGEGSFLDDLASNRLGRDGRALCVPKDGGPEYYIDLGVSSSGHPSLPVVKFETVSDSVDLPTVNSVTADAPTVEPSPSTATTTTADTNSTEKVDYSGLSLAARFATSSFGASLFCVSDLESTESSFAAGSASALRAPGTAPTQGRDCGSGRVPADIADDRITKVRSRSSLKRAVGDGSDETETKKSRCYDDLFGFEDIVPEVLAVDSRRVIATMDDVRKFHLRFGHASKNFMSSIATSLGYTITPAAKKMMAPSTLACRSCRATVALNKRVSSINGVRSERVNEILVIDHLKVQCPSVIDQATTALITIDDYSRYCWVDPSERHEAPAYLVHRLWHNYNLGHGIPAAISSDEAFEFDALEAPEFTRLGIAHHTGGTRHHENIGLAERKVRTLKWKMVALLHQCRLPHMFWPYALKQANWLLNWLPSNAAHLKGERPALVFGDRQPFRDEFVKAFGCDVSFHSGTGDTHKNSLDLQVLQGLFLGMSWNQFDSTALVLVPSKQRVQAVPYQKLNFFPESFSLAHRVYIAFANNLPRNLAPNQAYMPLPVLCANVQAQLSSDLTVVGDTIIETPPPSPFLFDDSDEDEVPHTTSASTFAVGYDAQQEVIHELTLQHLRALRASVIGAKHVDDPNDDPFKNDDIDYEDNGELDPSHESTVELALNQHKAVPRGRPLKTTTGVRSTKHKRVDPLLTLHSRQLIETPADRYVYWVCANSMVSTCPEQLIQPSSPGDPRSYKHAMKSDPVNWGAAVATELGNMHSKNVWTLCKLDYNKMKRILRLHWVFRLKRDSSNRPTKHKGRLVVLGNRQTPDQYDQTYAAVIQKSGICLFFVTVFKHQFATIKLDVTAAFLNGELKEDIYCWPPEGLDVPKGTVLKLNKALYGLKQAPRAWYDTFYEYITSRGFTPVTEEESLFLLHKGGTLVAVLALYVDDILLGGMKDVLDAEVAALHDRFEISDEGPIDEYLGIKIDLGEQGACLSLPGKITQMVEELRTLPQIREICDAKQDKDRGTPMDTSFKNPIRDELCEDTGSDDPSDVNAMQRVAGCVNYLFTCGRVDLGAVSVHLSTTASRPRRFYWKVAANLLKYLEATKNMTLVLSSKEGIVSPNLDKSGIVVYTDASFGQLPSGKAIMATLVYVNGVLVCWKSKVTRTHPDSTFEAELNSLRLGVKLARSIRPVAIALGLIKSSDLIKVWCDARTVVDAITSRNYSTSTETKYVLDKIRKLRSWHEDGLYMIRHVASKDMKADVLTKAMDHKDFVQCLGSLPMFLSPPEVLSALGGHVEDNTSR